MLKSALPLAIRAAAYVSSSRLFLDYLSLSPRRASSSHSSSSQVEQSFNG